MPVHIPVNTDADRIHDKDASSTQKKTAMHMYAAVTVHPIQNSTSGTMASF